MSAARKTTIAFLAVAACGAAAERAGAWTVRVQSHCEAMNPAFCQGAYGAVINASGRLSAGPAPDGRVLAGRLDETARRALDRAVQRALAGARENGPACMARRRLPGVGETVTLTEGARTITLQGASGAMDSTCAPGAPAALAPLFTQAHRAMLKIYPRPFPQ
ncbi:MAG: hypothetical protein KGL46_03455 [Hyphomicrobiales bacterium]|nr:hypothetical protein [Hyphomicrobiales bacterium]